MKDTKTKKKNMKRKDDDKDKDDGALKDKSDVLAAADDTDPRVPLPRDPTGRYLHLKLKRFDSIDQLTMPFAIKMWRKFPHDAEIDVAPTARSTCRQCRRIIDKGAVRVKLYLQCHQGCKNAAYFHHDNNCAADYPEFAKLISWNELVGLEELSEKLQKEVREQFVSRNRQPPSDDLSPPKKKARKG